MMSPTSFFAASHYFLRFGVLCYVLLLIISLFVSGCTKVHDVTPAGKQAALRQADIIINDPNALLLTWYRSRLLPSYTVETEETHTSFRTDIYHRAVPAVTDNTFLYIIIISNIFYIPYLALLHTRGKLTDGLSDSVSPETIILIGSCYLLLLNALPFIFILVAKAVVYVFWPSQYYIPWRFCVFIGYLIVNVINFIEIFVPRLRQILRHIEHRVIIFLSGLKKKKLKKEAASSQVRLRIHAIVSHADQLNGNVEDDAINLDIIGEHVQDLIYESIGDAERKDIAIVVDKLVRLRYTESSIYSRLDRIMKKH